MKTISVIALALTAAVAFAQQPAAQPPQVNGASSAPSPAEFDKQMAQVRENIKKMQEQMNGIQASRDPQERQRLLQEHWSAMQNTMTTMHNMWGAGMPGCCGGAGAHNGMMGGPMTMGRMMDWHNAGNFYSNLTPEQLRQRQYMTDQYLNMQQQMMGHMMWHQHWLNQVPRDRK